MEYFEFMNICGSLDELNVDKGLKYCVNNIDNYRKALFVALKSIRGKLPLLWSMVEFNEYESFCNVAGALGRICNNIGAVSLGEETVVLQTYSLNEEYMLLSCELPKYIARLEKLLSGLEEVLRELDHSDKEGGKGNSQTPSEVFLKETFSKAQ